MFFPVSICGRLDMFTHFLALLFPWKINIYPNQRYHLCKHLCQTIADAFQLGRCLMVSSLLYLIHTQEYIKQWHDQWMFCVFNWQNLLQKHQRFVMFFCEIGRNYSISFFINEKIPKQQQQRIHVTNVSFSMSHTHASMRLC